MALEFDSADLYIESATSLKDKVAKIDIVITALLATAAKSAANAHITSYSIDNGQTKINAEYAGTAAVFESIKGFETLREYYKQKINGRVFRMMDGKNFNRNRRR